jgi:glycosyltransferase involved in cell wall biosynthesis
MRVVFDCRSVFPGMGGIGRSAAALARELPRAAPRDEFLLLTGARAPATPLASAPNAREVPVEAAMIDPLFEQVRLPALLEELEADLYHNPCFTVPIARGRARRVATVHDVVFRRHPELVESGLRAYLDRWTDVACDLADAVVTVSEVSRREIEVLYGRPASRIDVVPNAVSDEFFAVERRRLPGPPMILYVGALEAKKNVEALVRAYAALVRTSPALPHHLVLAGAPGPAPIDLAPIVASEPAITGRVHVLGHVPDDHLRALYGGADLFCYLSEYEGFGLPPLEAMAAGVPTIVANRSSLPEVAAGEALLVEPHDPDAVAHAMRRVLSDRLLADDLAERGRARARSFSWQASARQLAAIYSRVVQGDAATSLRGAA